MREEALHRQHVIAFLWDCDKTLIAGYMQTPIFRRFGIDEEAFWNEVNALPALYAERGIRVSPETVYLNHLLTHVRLGRLGGLNNALLHALGAELPLYPGLPGFFDELRASVRDNPRYRKRNITVEHYIVSTGLAEMIRGSSLAPHVDGIFASELIENPAPPNFLDQEELSLDGDVEISQIGFMVDNTIKTRFLFEINKGSNVNPAIDVNAKVALEDRRVQLRNMIYIADGPSDVPSFSIIKKNGGLAYAVFDPASEEEFAQNDDLLQAGRIHAYGPADYTPGSTTARWLQMHLGRICERLVKEADAALDNRVGQPPRHLRQDEEPVDETASESVEQPSLLDEESG